MTVSNERKIISVPTISLDDIEGMSVKEARDYFDGLITRYGESATINRHSFPYDERDYLYVFVKRPETDEECAKRVSEERRYAELALERERAEFLRLKQKFGVGDN